MSESFSITRFSELHRRSIVRSYRSFGNATVPAFRLSKLITELLGELDRPVEPELYEDYFSVANMQIDYAVHHAGSPEAAVHLISLAGEYLAQVPNIRLHESSEYHHHAIRAMILGAYIPFYEKFAKSQPIDADDYTDLYARLYEGLSTATQLFNNNKKRRSPQANGAEFELAMHTLHARSIAKRDEVFSYMWPSLLRQDAPLDGTTIYKQGWDTAISAEGFLGNVDSLLQLKSSKESVPVTAYDSRIVIVNGCHDLQLAYPGELSKALVNEWKSENEQVRLAATNKLDTIEQKFFTTIGWTYEEQN